MRCVCLDTTLQNLEDAKLFLFLFAQSIAKLVDRAQNAFRVTIYRKISAFIQLYMTKTVFTMRIRIAQNVQKNIT